MSNDPKMDLIYATLAMDAYNRGYGKGITLLEETGQLGNWDLRANSSILRDINGDRLDYGDSALNYQTQIFHGVKATHCPNGSLSPCGLTSAICSANVLIAL